MRNPDNQFTESVSYGLDYVVGVPESLIEELEHLPAEEIGARYSFTEVDGEILGFLEDAFLSVEGLKETVPEFDIGPWTGRIERLRGPWDGVAVKAAAVSRVSVTRSFVDSMKAKPHEFWWYNRFAELVEPSR